MVYPAYPEGMPMSPSSQHPASMRITPEFAAALDKFDLGTLESESGAVYALDRDLQLCYFNPAWYRFAQDNHGEPAITERYPLGTPLLHAISGPLQSYYLDAYTRVLHEGLTWQHDYECSSGSVYRRFHQKSYPLANGRAVIVINSLSITRPHEDSAEITTPPDESRYRGSHGLIVQCSHCRRVQRAAQPEHWDWVPAWVDRLPPRVSHSLCQPCYDYYYRFRPGRTATPS